MRKIDVRELKDNFFEAIGKEWMLVTAGTTDHFNLMTASWGGIGWLWNKPVAFVFIRPERYTFEFAEQSDCMTLSFLGMSKEAREIYKICGTKSGRDMNKVESCGLSVEATEQGGVAYQQARLTLVGRKLYADDLKPDGFVDTELLGRWYSSSEEAKKLDSGITNGLHKMYVIEITGAYVPVTGDRYNAEQQKQVAF